MRRFGSYSKRAKVLSGNWVCSSRPRLQGPQNRWKCPSRAIPPVNFCNLPFAHNCTKSVGPALLQIAKSGCVRDLVRTAHYFGILAEDTSEVSGWSTGTVNWRLLSRHRATCAVYLAKPRSCMYKRPCLIPREAQRIRRTIKLGGTVNKGINIGSLTRTTTVLYQLLQPFV